MAHGIQVLRVQLTFGKLFSGTGTWDGSGELSYLREKKAFFFATQPPEHEAIPNYVNFP